MMQRYFMGFLPGLMMVLAGSAAAAPAPLPETMTCLANRDIRAKRTSAADGYFAQTPRGWWHNTGAACPAYAPGRALVTRSNQDRQCRGDLVVVFDAISRIEFGGCPLGNWVRVAGPPPGK